MKKFKTIKIITPIVVASAAIPVAAIAIKNATQDKQNNKTIVQSLKTSVLPNDALLTSDEIPLMLQNISDKNGWIKFENSDSTYPVKVYYRGQTWDGGWKWSTWKAITFGEKPTYVEVEPNTKIQICGFSEDPATKGRGFSWGVDDEKCIKIQFLEDELDKGARFALGGNVFSLLCNEFVESTDTIQCGVLENSYSDYCFARLFANSNALSYVSPNFFGKQRYEYNTYSELYSAGLTPHCFERMFENCTNLKAAPDLPGLGTWTSLPMAGYRVAPGLPEACYKGMFAGCTSLQTAPYLKAYILGKDCYNSMFKGCSLLNSINIAYAGAFKKDYFDNWVQGVDSNGYMFYNGYDDSKDETYEIPKNFSVISNDDVKAKAVTLEIPTPAADATYAISNPKKAKTLILPDEPGFWMPRKTTAEPILLKQAIGQMDGYGSKITNDPFENWYNSSKQVISIADNGPTVKKYVDGSTSAVIIPNYGSTQEDVNEKLTNVVVDEDTTITVTYQAGSETKIYYEEANGKADWEPFESGVGKTFTKGAIVYLKGNLGEANQSETSKTQLKISGGQVKLVGNVMSLIYNHEVDTTDQSSTAEWRTIPQPYQFKNFFWGSDGIISVDENYLPAENLTPMCYSGMFGGCKNLTIPPKLPATNLTNAGGCYNAMYYGAGLTEMPELPSQQLPEPFYNADYTTYVGAYSDMFAVCKSLKTVKPLPATTVPALAYSHMFQCCSALEKAPEIAAETFTEPTVKELNTQAGTCFNMFLNCTSLKTGPSELKVTTATKNCYFTMFNGCNTLTTPPIIKLTTLAEGCCYQMFMDCTSLSLSKNSGSSRTQFFKVPYSVPTNATYQMFQNITTASYFVTPSSNTTIYYKY